MVKIKKNVVKKPLKRGINKKKVRAAAKITEPDPSTMSVDEFMQQDFVEDDSENQSEAEIEPNMEDLLKIDDKGGEETESDKNDEADEFAKHKVALSKLKDTDPEFYQFLEDNDKKLLQFNLSDEEQDDGDDDEEADDLHKIPQDLEVASDESDFEEDEKQESRGNVTLKMLKKWEETIQKDTTNKTITSLIDAFHGALIRISSEDSQDDAESRYRVDGSAVFNGIIQVCVLRLGPALRRFLGIKDGSKQPPHKCKKFNKIKRQVKDYFGDLSKLLSSVTSSNIQTVLLKHLHYMSPFLQSYPNITRTILKRLIRIWGTAEESVRVIAFFCILRITNSQRVKFLDTVLKSMYITYVKNSKFVSVGSLASINFMRRSLVEMFALDYTVTYQHVFLYIRQLAIHLRNAITVNKKENVQAVYNWQYINSLRLWGNLLSSGASRPQIRQLIYPFVQVCLGVLKLVPTVQYYPLRFHVVQCLMDLSRESGVFVPILPFILDVLSFYDFDKKHKKISMKPQQFTCLLRASKSQMLENGFKDALIDAIYGSLLEYLSSWSHVMAFPDLTLICVVQLKQFVKKCSNANYIRKMKQVIEKIEQNNHFIESERAKMSLEITHSRKIEGWESQMRNKGTPMTQFYESWHKLHTVKKNKQLTNNDAMGDYKLPTLKKRTLDEKRKRSEGPVELFPSSSEDSEDEVVEEVKPKRMKKKVGKSKARDSGPVVDSGERDIVEDLKVDDW